MTLFFTYSYYFFFRKMKLKTKQVTANTSPAVAAKIYTTERGIASVTVFTTGMPSPAIPSVIENRQKRYRGKQKRKHLITSFVMHNNVPACYPHLATLGPQLHPPCSRKEDHLLSLHPPPSSDNQLWKHVIILNTKIQSHTYLPLQQDAEELVFC